jgi:hypothetical protein
VISRRVFAVLTTILVLLFPTTLVVTAVHALLSALGDTTGAHLSLWLAAACVACMSVDAVLLVAALGLRATQSADDRIEDA